MSSSTIHQITKCINFQCLVPKPLRNIVLDPEPACPVGRDLKIYAFRNLGTIE